ncbi:MAG: sodium/solute symporter [Calditrichaeota bacterium]|nr:sodium/solute symporter [Calditrichota bacterium]
MALKGIDIVIVLLYMGGIVGIGVYFKKYISTSEDFFLAGKMLPFWAIGMSIVVSDIGAVDFVGLTGQAYRYGIVVGNMDWIGSIPAMILAALVFIPYYWRAGVFTIPEYLGRRYNTGVRAIHASMWLIVMAFGLGVTLWATGVLLSELMGWPIMISIVITAVVVGFYTMMGGLSAVVMSDVVQLIIMFVGGIAILVLGLWQLGGWEAMVQKIQSLGPEYAHHFTMIVSPKENTPYPWTGILFGLAIVLAPAYFIANQTIVQRSLGARNEWHAKASVLWGAFLKMFIPVLFVFPGLIALALYPGIADGDRAFPIMIKRLLPPGMTGLLFAAFFSGLMSTIDSAVNSTATIWTKDIYQRFIKKDASDRHLLIMGRVFTVVLMVFAVATAPITSLFPGMYVYMQTLLSFIQGPSLAILILGMFWARATQWGGLVGLVGGFFISAGLYIFKSSLFTIEDPFLFISWWSFLGSLILTVSVSLFTRPYPLEKLRGLVYGMVLKDEKLQNVIEKNMSKE